MPTSISAANRRGVLAMSFAMASFIANDALVKYVSASLPAAQLIFIRGMFSTGLLLLVAQRMGLLWSGKPKAQVGPWTHLKQRPVLWRSALDAVGTMTYLTSLFHLPIGNATAINMAAPLLMSLFAVLVWRERVSLARWIAIGAGFAGVLLVVQPAAAGFTWWALLCLLATLVHTTRDLITRSIHPGVPSVLITVAAAAAATLLAGLTSLVEGWGPVSWPHLGLLAGASVFLSVGYYLVIVGMREGDISVVAPFRYTGLLFALLIGWVVWGDVPNALAWAGITLLVGAGLFMLRSGRRR